MSIPLVVRDSGKETLSGNILRQQDLEDTSNLSREDPSLALKIMKSIHAYVIREKSNWEKLKDLTLFYSPISATASRRYGSWKGIFHSCERQSLLYAAVWIRM